MVVMALTVVVADSNSDSDVIYCNDSNDDKEFKDPSFSPK